MGDATGISWTDMTWNPIRGCTRVSAGCVHCYAEQQAARTNRQAAAQGRVGPYEHLVRLVGPNKEPRWTGNVRMVLEHLLDPIRKRKPRKIFVNSMSDLFHEALTNEQIAAIFGVMAVAGWHTFQILTKRAKRMREWFKWLARESRECNDGRGMSPAMRCFIETQKMFPAPSDVDRNADLVTAGHIVELAMGAQWPLPNVWVGVSVEDQDAANERIKPLLETPAVVRFLSCEPLLGEVDLERRLGVWTSCPDCGENVRVDEDGCCVHCGADAYHYGVDWVIVGCESGPGARHCDYRWIRKIRDQCKKAKTPIFVKQAKGAMEDGEGIDRGAIRRGPNIVIAGGPGAKKKPGGIFELPYVDGVQHAEFPQPRE